MVVVDRLAKFLNQFLSQSLVRRTDSKGPEPHFFKIACCCQKSLDLEVQVCSIAKVVLPLCELVLELVPDQLGVDLNAQVAGEKDSEEQPHP